MMTVTGPVEFAGTGSVNGCAYGSEAPLARLAITVRVILGQVSIDDFPKKPSTPQFCEIGDDLVHQVCRLDKMPTVEMVHASVLMKELWPNAGFIFMKRRLFEGVLSRQRKFPEDTTERHYSEWRAVMTAWLVVHGKLGAAALKIEHRHLVSEPDAAAYDPIRCALGYRYDDSYFVTEVGPPAVITA
jgi:hypothetical protein